MPRSRAHPVSSCRVRMGSSVRSSIRPAAGELDHPRVTLLPESHQFDDLVQGAGMRVVPAELIDRLGDSEVGVDPGRLEHNADPGLERWLTHGRVVPDDGDIPPGAVAE